MTLPTVRSERQFCELDYNLVFRWFLDMDIVQQSFVTTVPRRAASGFLAHDVAGELFRAARDEADELRAFTVEGDSVIESSASLKAQASPGTLRQPGIQLNRTRCRNGQAYTCLASHVDATPSARPSPVVTEPHVGLRRHLSRTQR